MKVLKKIAMHSDAYLCAIAIAVMSVVGFVQVAVRFNVKSSLPWSEELSRDLQVYITFFGTAYGIQTGAHLGIEAFTHLLPKGGRKVLAILVQIVSMSHPSNEVSHTIKHNQELLSVQYQQSAPHILDQLYLC